MWYNICDVDLTLPLWRYQSAIQASIRACFSVFCPTLPDRGLINFEDIPGSMDNQPLPIDYGSNKGVEISLVKIGTFDPYHPQGLGQPMRPILEAAGSADGVTGFWSSCGSAMRDRDHEYSLGRMFLRYPKKADIPQFSKHGLPSLLIKYIGNHFGTEEASGSLYDLDEHNNRQEPFKVTAWDDSDPPLMLDEVFGPTGPKAECNPDLPVDDPDHKSWDSHGWQYTLRGTAEKKIKYIRIDYLGNAGADATHKAKVFPPMGFDHFNAFTKCHEGVFACVPFAWNQVHRPPGNRLSTCHRWNLETWMWPKEQ